ncbi:MAG: pseudouridine synthase [Thermomicrobiales bacterium]
MPRQSASFDDDRDELTASDEPVGERLQRVLASRGVASRRAAETMIVEGRVSVNGTVVRELGTRVDPLRDRIEVDNRSVRSQKTRILILNKPSGFITTVSDERQRWTVMHLVDVPERVYPVGRLDRDTEGLLLFTNDGALANRVMHPRYGLAKEYHVLARERPTGAQLQEVKDGLMVSGRLVVPEECRLLRETGEGATIKIVLHEGIYHVVRRMMEMVGIKVVRLRRMRLGPIALAGLPLANWRDLSTGEVLQLYDAVGLPAEDADRANQGRTIHVGPPIDFRHGGKAAQKAGEPEQEHLAAYAHVPRRERGRRPPSRTAEDDNPTPSGSSERTQRPLPAKPEKDAWKRAGQGERIRRPKRDDRDPDRRDRPSRSGGNARPPQRSTQPNDGSRPSQGHRDRRSGSGR